MACADAAIRVDMLAQKLRERIIVWKENKDSLVEQSKELVEESFGAELLNTVGYVYVQKAKVFQGKQKFLGIPGFFRSVADKAHIAKETMSAIGAAVDIQRTTAQLDPANPASETLSDEQKAAIEAAAVEKSMHAMWCFSKLDVESAVRNAVERILLNDEVPIATRVEESKTLREMGDHYLRISKKKVAENIASRQEAKKAWEAEQRKMQAERAAAAAAAAKPTPGATKGAAASKP